MAFSISFLKVNHNSNKTTFIKAFFVAKKNCKYSLLLVIFFQKLIVCQLCLDLSLETNKGTKSGFYYLNIGLKIAICLPYITSHIIKNDFCKEVSKFETSKVRVAKELKF